MINAFKYGAPPHAGCAFGIDRIFMVLIGEDNIREVVAFPKNGSGIDTMMNSPSIVDPAQLKELSL
jgi:aspartyl-tRNA synthetase